MIVLERVSGQGLVEVERTEAEFHADWQRTLAAEAAATCRETREQLGDMLCLAWHPGPAVADRVNGLRDRLAVIAAEIDAICESLA